MIQLYVIYAICGVVLLLSGGGTMIGITSILTSDSPTSDDMVSMRFVTSVGGFLLGALLLYKAYNMEMKEHDEDKNDNNK